MHQNYRKETEATWSALSSSEPPLNCSSPPYLLCNRVHGTSSHLWGQLHSLWWCHHFCVAVRGLIAVDYENHLHKPSIELGHESSSNCIFTLSMHTIPPFMHSGQAAAMRQWLCFCVGTMNFGFKWLLLAIYVHSQYSIVEGCLAAAGEPKKGVADGGIRPSWCLFPLCIQGRSAPPQAPHDNNCQWCMYGVAKHAEHKSHMQKKDKCLRASREMSESPKCSLRSI